MNMKLIAVIILSGLLLTGCSTKLTPFTLSTGAVIYDTAPTSDGTAQGNSYIVPQELSVPAKPSGVNGWIEVEIANQNGKPVSWYTTGNITESDYIAESFLVSPDNSKDWRRTLGIVFALIGIGFAVIYAQWETLTEARGKSIRFYLIGTIVITLLNVYIITASPSSVICLTPDTVCVATNPSLMAIATAFSAFFECLFPYLIIRDSYKKHAIKGTVKNLKGKSYEEIERFQRETPNIAPASVNQMGAATVTPTEDGEYIFAYYELEEKSRRDFTFVTVWFISRFFIMEFGVRVFMGASFANIPPLTIQAFASPLILGYLPIMVASIVQFTEILSEYKQYSLFALTANVGLIFMISKLSNIYLPELPVAVLFVVVPFIAFFIAAKTKISDGPGDMILLNIIAAIWLVMAEEWWIFGSLAR